MDLTDMGFSWFLMQYHESELEWLVDCCEYGCELLGFVKGREFLDKLSSYWLLKNLAAWS
jgi:hypothetical protein